MSTQPQTERHIALLIDGDNAQYKFIKEMLEEVSRYGTATYRRAYGDWTTPNLASWREVMLSNAIQPAQQFRYTTGKNATDSALIIDAMDILSSKTVQGFCIISSDSDFTRLCTRIRESGLFVMGIGEKKTPESFVKACNVFVYIENLIPPPPQPESTDLTDIPDNQNNPIDLLNRAYAIAVQEDGWVTLGMLGHTLRLIAPDFDSRTYGYPQLYKLIKSLPNEFILKKDKTAGDYVKRIED